MNMDTITTMFTPAQAAVITGLSLREVQKAIDNRVVPAKRSRQGKQIRRYLSQDALVCLHLESGGLSFFPPATRQRLIADILRSPRLQRVHPAATVTVDVKPSRRLVSAAVKLLRKAESMVSMDPARMSGVPVFKGTRVPVHQIALEIERGATEIEVIEDYPTVSREQAEMAVIYARAYPRTGRPTRPASDQPRPIMVLTTIIPDFGKKCVS